MNTQEETNPQHAVKWVPEGASAPRPGSEAALKDARPQFHCSFDFCNHRLALPVLGAHTSVSIWLIWWHITFPVLSSMLLHLFVPCHCYVHIIVWPHNKAVTCSITGGHLGKFPVLMISHDTILATDVMNSAALNILVHVFRET